MTAQTPGFVGARLEEARRARGMSATDLADLVGVSLQSISKYENGHQTPKLDVLLKLSWALKFSRPYFMRPIELDDQNPVFWRAKLSAPPIKRERAAVRLQWMKEVVDYIAGFFDLLPLNVPKLKMPITSTDVDEIENAAKAIRDHWEIRPGPMPDVIEKLEANGILVARIHVGAEKLDAFSQWSRKFNIPFVVLSRDKASAARQRFDVLHELAHVTLHHSVNQTRLNDRASYKVIEKQADLLACALLLPEEEFLEELYAPSLDAFVAMKERWGVSVAAMIMRCRVLDIIDEEEGRRLWINYNRRGWRKGEPLDNKMEKEKPHNIRRSFELLMSENIQSASDILRALPFPATDLEEIADLEPGTLSGAVEARPEPTLKAEFLRAPSNVVSIFDKKS